MPDDSTPAASAGISISILLLQAQRLLNDADEANHCGDYSTFGLQRQAREVLAEAIDRLTLADLIAQRNSALAAMRTAGADMEAFRRARLR